MLTRQQNNLFFGWRFAPAGASWACLALVGLLWSGATALQAADYYVVPTNSGQANPYSDWGTAGTNIIEVVNAAMTNSATPRIVWVSNGVYALTNQIIITNALTLQSTNGPEVTVINGNFIPGSPETNRCLMLSNAAALVHGFTISNGAFVGKNNEGGGGVRIYSGTLSNCTVRNNIVFAPPVEASLDGGGGIYIQPSGTAIVCRVIDNIATNNAASYPAGGGIFSYRFAGTFNIIGCLISNNVAYGTNAAGGGVYLGAFSGIKSSMICNNRAPINGQGGGVYMVGYGMNDSTVTLNQAYTWGGVVLRQGIISNCVISKNWALSSGRCAGLGNDHSGNPHMAIDTTIIGNTNGGLQFGAGGTGTNFFVNLLIISNTVYGVQNNSLNYQLLNSRVIDNIGYGILWKNGVIRNCLIAGNSNSTTFAGLSFSADSTNASVSGCTIVNNMSPGPGAGLKLSATNTARSISVSSCIIYSNGVNGADDVYDACTPTNAAVLQYSCIGSNSGFTGTRIITNADPQFVSFAAGNYRLAANSPCINTGSNEAWMTNSFDLDDKNRIRYETVDMGAYEHLYKGSVFRLY